VNGYYLVLDRKPHEGEFRSNGATINSMNLFWFLNQQSSIANQQSCLNGAFVQALFKMPGPLFFVFQNIAIGVPQSGAEIIGCIIHELHAISSAYRTKRSIPLLNYG